MKCLKFEKKGDDSHAKKVTEKNNEAVARFIKKEINCVKLITFNLPRNEVEANNDEKSPSLWRACYVLS